MQAVFYQAHCAWQRKGQLAGMFFLVALHCGAHLLCIQAGLRHRQAQLLQACANGARQGCFRQLHAQDPEVLQDVSVLAVGSDGDRWLNGGKGLVHVRRDDWLASVADPSVLLRYQLYGVQDGYPGKAMLENRHPSAKLDKDGQLWLVARVQPDWQPTRTIKRR